jgi:multicomponent Na+:H+ antiporter subunit E
MKLFILLFVLLTGFWMLLSGWDPQEFFTAVIVSGIVSILTYRVFDKPGKSYPKRFVYLLAYIPYYIWQEIKCHADVIYRIITGKIDPAIVEVPNIHKSDWGTMALSNSITMTPGTLTLEVDKDSLFVHWIYAHGDKKGISGAFDKLLTKIWN